MKAQNRSVYFGAVASIFLLAGGILLLPFGDGGGIEHLFTLVWLAAAVMTAIAFTGEVLRREKLKKFQERWKSTERSRRMRSSDEIGRTRRSRLRVRNQDE